MTRKRVSIIVCTKGRLNFLKHSIKSLSNNTLSVYDTEVIVVNNSDNREIQKAIIEVCKSYEWLIYKPEPQIGLSYARNTGIKQAQSPWLLFLDDDVQLPDDFLQKALTIINTDQFDCFGGMYYPWYLTEKPRWLPESFGQKIPLRDTTGSIIPGVEGYLSAGIFAVKRVALEKVGAFRTDLGMGPKIGYGEEDELQIRLHEAGYRIGFVPDWWMKHAVLPHKYSLSWQLRSVYARARDAHFIQKNTAATATVFKILGSFIAALFKRLPLAIWKLLTKREYYWQNAILEIWTPIMAYIGRYQGIRNYNKSQG